MDSWGVLMNITCNRQYMIIFLFVISWREINIPYTLEQYSVHIFDETFCKISILNYFL
ncbi:Uncharacterised protein [Mycobacteroides abscessus subsp. massiliense]|nr:Uncharacterised protein [Mycobacteroides abscessus subsp. massiliense]